MRAAVVGCGLGILAACAELSPTGSSPSAETSAAASVETSGPTSASATSATSAESAAPSAIASEPEALPSEFMEMAPAGDYLKELRGAFRRCYQKALADDPKMQGSVKLHVSLEANGVVERVTPKSREGLSEKMVECCALAVKEHTFDPPPPDKRTLTIPLSFMKQ